MGINNLNMDRLICNSHVNYHYFLNLEWLSFSCLKSEKSISQIHEEDDKIWLEEGPPPSYDSLFGQIKEAKETSDGSFDFCKRVVQLFAGTSKSAKLLNAS